jgi:hypothetical protein
LCWRVVDIEKRKGRIVGILLAFAPFIVFAIVDRLIGPTEGLMSGAVIAIVLLVRDWITPGRMPELLEIGTALLFAGLAIYAVLAGPTWSVVDVRLCVDTLLAPDRHCLNGDWTPVHLAIRT